MFCVCLSDCQSICPSVCQYVCQSVCLSVCLSVGMFVGRSVCHDCAFELQFEFASLSFSLYIFLFSVHAGVCVRFASSSSFLISFNLQCQQRLTFDCKTTTTTAAISTTIVRATATAIVVLEILSVCSACLPSLYVMSSSLSLS